ncbi:hypothetical protein [Pedobacter sp. UBA4863]|uniref:hypothetical protein n=1 Tax=Pedobacter sp. UBA4863 TaxID=1947060 RepID=UPI0025F4A206|nr:hypothetical protein [Pedobacter sp. UBA4863]
MSKNLKTFPQLFEKALPVPDQDTTINAVYDTLYRVKGPFDGPFAIVFVGLFAINFFAFTDWMDNHPLTTYLPWAVVFFTMLALWLLIAQQLKQNSELVKQIEQCYTDYHKDYIHVSYSNEIDIYHGCLGAWKYHHLEKVHLLNYSKMHDIENRWLAHIRQFGPTNILAEMHQTPRGQRLETYGFFPFYFLSGEPLRLSKLYKDYLTFEETLRVFEIYKTLKASFEVEVDDLGLAKAMIAHQSFLADEEAEILKETNECLQNLIEIEQDRQAAYLKFKRRYLELTKDLDAQQTPFI